MNVPDHIRLIVNNAPKRGAVTGSGAARKARPDTSQPQPGARRTSPPAELVTLLTRENQAGSSSRIPTPEEAREALRRLQEDLPTLGEEVNDLHSKLDRSRILSLLAPLVEP